MVDISTASVGVVGQQTQLRTHPYTPLINQELPSPSVPGSTQQEQFRRVFEEVWDETSGFDQLGAS